MKRVYEELEFETIRFSTEDVITASEEVVNCRVENPYPDDIVDGKYMGPE